MRLGRRHGPGKLRQDLRRGQRADGVQRGRQGRREGIDQEDRGHEQPLPGGAPAQPPRAPAHRQNGGRAARAGAHLHPHGGGLQGDVVQGVKVGLGPRAALATGRRDAWEGSMHGLCR